MSDLYRLIRHNRTGELEVCLASGTDGNLVYLVAGPKEVLATMERFPFVPGEIGVARVGSVDYSVYEVPQGTPLENLLPAITEEQALGAMHALTLALSLLIRMGCALSDDGVAERLLVRDQNGEWQFDFAAACLATGEDGATLSQCLAPTFVRLLTLPQLKGSKPLSDLERRIREFPYRTPEEWEAEFTVRAPEEGGAKVVAAPKRRFLLGWALVVLLVAAGSWYGLKQGAAERATARPEPTGNPMPQPLEVAKPAPQGEAPAKSASEQAGAEVVAKPEPSADVEQEDPAEVAWMKSRRRTVLKPEPQTKPVQTAATVPAMPPNLPGPYCEKWGESTRGYTRYLLLDGKRLCTAHVRVTGGATYISADALSRVALLEGIRLESNEFTQVAGRLWIRLSANTMGRFNLTVVAVDGTNIHLAGRSH